MNHVDEEIKNYYKMTRYQLVSSFQEILYLLIGPLLFFLINMKNICFSFVHLEGHAFKISFILLEKGTPTSSCVPQEDKISSLVPFVNNNDPILSIPFESFLEQNS